MGTALDTESGTTTNGADGAFGTALGREARPRRAKTAPYQQMSDEDRGTGGESLADFLGYFSIGLGLAEVLAPQAIARVIGIKHPEERNRTLIRLMGLRELGAGLSILSNQHPEKSLWSRVAGDALDLALLGGTFANPENDRGRTLFATLNVLAVTALDVMAARQLAQQPRTAVREKMEQGVVVTRRSLTVRKSPEEVYAFWRDPANLARFMRHVESVTPIDDRRARWVMKAPAGKTIAFDAEIVDDRPGELISWQALPDSPVPNAGMVRFTPAPGGRGTEVRLILEYEPPFGKLGSKLAMLWREEPGQQAMDSLRQLKQVLETGEVLVSDATKQRGPHPAQPDDLPVQL